MPLEKGIVRFPENPYFEFMISAELEKIYSTINARVPSSVVEVNTSPYVLSVNSGILFLKATNAQLTLPDSGAVFGKRYLIKNLSGTSYTISVVSGDRLNDQANGSVSTNKDMMLIATDKGWISLTFN